MYKYLSLTLFFIAALSFSSCNNDKENTGDNNETADTTQTDPISETPPPPTETPDNFDEAWGMMQANGLKGGLQLTAGDINFELLRESFAKVVNGEEPSMTPMAAQMLLQQEAQKLQQNPAQKNINPKFWEALGLMIAKNPIDQGMKAEKLNVDDFMKGFKAVYDGGELPMPMDQANKMVNQEIQRLSRMAAEINAQKGKEFMAENAKNNPNIKTTPSGIQYEVLKEGTGPKPTAQNKVRTHYHGTLIDGTVFDSSVDRGQPAEFPVGGVIKGWQEILQMMPVGSKWKVYIPGNLAYGPQGSPPKIGPNATLIFEIELLKIVG